MKKDLINAFLSLLLTATMLGLVFSYEKNTNDALLAGNYGTEGYSNAEQADNSFVAIKTDNTPTRSEPCYIDYDARPDHLN